LQEYDPSGPTGPGEGGILHPEVLSLQILQTLPPGFKPGWKSWEGVGVPSGQCPLGVD